LGPVFGVKGGAAGGGHAQVAPMEDLNLHFTGDFHAITTANNLISAVIDNHLYYGNKLNINPNKIVWRRCIDLNDRALRKIEIGLNSKKETKRYDYFNITAASEVMAMLCLATSVDDLKSRLDNTLVAYTYENMPIYIKDLGITGALLVILKDAIKPNLIQTLENNLMIIHGGPFANIAHGCNSILATKLALKLSDYVVTEAGFGADLGAEKFLDIKCQEAKLNPNLVVIVATLRALKYHGGAQDLNVKNLDALSKGIENLEKHLEIISLSKVKSVIALNKFPNDHDDEIEYLKKWAKEKGFPIALSEVYEKGSEGGIALAEEVLKNLDDSKYEPIYNLQDTLLEKIDKIAYNVYGATSVVFAPGIKEQLIDIDKKYPNFYVCVAKTPNSLTDNPKIIGRPKDFSITIKEVRIATGCKFVICLTGKIMTMPGLNEKPLALQIGLDENYEIYGLM
jgi:formate--tetrahydrofolate ligase